jgi:hypothetical protein
LSPSRSALLAIALCASRRRARRQRSSCPRSPTDSQPARRSGEVAPTGPPHRSRPAWSSLSAWPRLHAVGHEAAAAAEFREAVDRAPDSAAAEFPRGRRPRPRLSRRRIPARPSTRPRFRRRRIPARPSTAPPTQPPPNSARPSTAPPIPPPRTTTSASCCSNRAPRCPVWLTYRPFCNVRIISVK